MTQNMKEFVELISTNPRAARDVQEVNESITKEAMEAMRLVAARYGVSLAPEDFDIASSEDLEDDELDAVAGGKMMCVYVGFDMEKDPEGKYTPAKVSLPVSTTIRL